MSSQEEKIKYALYTCGVAILAGQNAPLDSFWMEEKDTYITSKLREARNGDYNKAAEEYTAILQESHDREITYEESVQGELTKYLILPRGACTLGWLANAGSETHIITLIKSGARPHKEYTLWRYGARSGVWEFLDGIYQGVQGRKMAKPAQVTHN